MQKIINCKNYRLKQRGIFQHTAFTLAEVLVTLGIIGVVAAMTLPALVQNYKEKATVTQLKKVYSASIGFTGVFGYVGAALSSSGTGFMVDKFGWNGAIGFWLISTLICVVICTILLLYEKQKKKSS